MQSQGAAARAGGTAGPAKGMHVRNRAVGGAVWTLMGQVAQQGMRLGTNILLSWLLPASAFGMMGLVAMINQALYMFSDVGIGTSIVNHKQGDDVRFLRTAWTIQIVRSFVITAIGLAVAYPFALFYAAPPATPVEHLLPVVLASLGALVINGFSSVSIYQASRELKIRQNILLDVYSQVVGAAVSIALAVWLRSVWALVVGNIATTMARLILSHTMLGGARMGLCWDAEARREMFKFGRWIFISTILTFLAMRVDAFMLPKLLQHAKAVAEGLSDPFTVFGLFGIALGLATVPVEVMNRIGGAVLLPAYSRVKDAKGTIPPRIFAQVSYVSLAASSLVIGGLVAVGPGFIKLAYKPTFHEAAAMIPLMGLVAWLRILQINASNALLALGKAKSTALSNGLKLAAMIVLVPLGWWLMDRPHSPIPGVLGAILGTAASEVVRYIVFLVDVRRSGQDPLRSDLRASLRLAVTAGLALGWHALAERWGLHAAVDMGVSALIVLAASTHSLWRSWVMLAPSVKVPAGVRAVMPEWIWDRLVVRPASAGGGQGSPNGMKMNSHGPSS